VSADVTGTIGTVVTTDEAMMTVGIVATITEIAETMTGVVMTDTEVTEGEMTAEIARRMILRDPTSTHRRTRRTRSTAAASPPKTRP